MSFVADMDILAEQQADQQRVVEENQLADLLRVARQQMLDAERAADEEAEAKRIQREQYNAGLLVKILAKTLGITIPIERVRIVDAGDFGEWYPAVEFAGLTFAYRVPTSRRYAEEAELVLARHCAKGCGKEVWVQVESRSEFVEALDSKSHQHSFKCHEPEKDYEIVDTVVTYPPTPAERYTAAIKRRRDLQFERAKEKEFAIRRIVANKGVTYNGESFVAGSPSAAEKLVEFDEGYAAACAAVTEAVIEEIAAREALRAAGGDPKREDEEA